jgi:hypothetical protein
MGLQTLRLKHNPNVSTTVSVTDYTLPENFYYMIQKMEFRLHKNVCMQVQVSTNRSV